MNAVAISFGQLVATTGITARQAALALGSAFASNSAMTCLAAATGGRVYALPVIAGIIVINTALFGTALWVS